MRKKLKNKGGRPTKYNKEILIKSKEYVKKCKDGFIKEVESINSKTGRKRFRTRLKVNLPKVEGLCLSLSITRSTAYEWAKNYKEFSDILEQINQIQANRVINEALSGRYNPLIAKLLLGKHGYKDDSKIEHSGGISLTEALKKADEEND